MSLPITSGPWSFLVADGVLPDSEESRGSVLRKVFMRMFRHADRLGIPGPKLVHLVEPVVETLGSVYPEIVERRALVERVIGSEAEVFRRRKEALDRLMARLPEGTTVIPGEVAFTWYDTHGIPRDFIEAEAQEHGLSVDWEGFEREMEKQRARSRLVVSYDTVGVTSEEATATRQTKFLGYTELSLEAPLEVILSSEGKTQEKAKAGEEVHFIFPKTPFYAEAGGQIADTGFVENLDREGKAEVLDVQKSPQGTLHKVRIVSGEFRQGDRCLLRVDEERRRKIQRAHTATHLLHAALRKVLGEHVIQAGSWVGPEELRFDFTHFSALTPAEIAEVEKLAFAAVLRDIPLHVEELPLEEAKKKGAIAHFEEEYRGKEKVRVVEVPGVSMELCGGTHVSRTGEIGPIVILSEESVASGTRRIRALVGERARSYLAELREERKKLSQLLEAPEGEVLAKSGEGFGRAFRPAAGKRALAGGTRSASGAGARLPSGRGERHEAPWGRRGGRSRSGKDFGRPAHGAFGKERGDFGHSPFRPRFPCGQGSRGGEGFRGRAGEGWGGGFGRKRRRPAQFRPGRRPAGGKPRPSRSQGPGTRPHHPPRFLRPLNFSRFPKRLRFVRR
jgi:alanyl-tRNA synthetase